LRSECSCCPTPTYRWTGSTISGSTITRARRSKHSTSSSTTSSTGDKDATRDFGIELTLAIRVNTRWDVATSESMTPREILALPQIALDFQQYTLYLPGSAEPLPLDAPVAITRGEVFEAQRDGKYGAR
jgi:hypothetical protein